MRVAVALVCCMVWMVVWGSVAGRVEAGREEVRAASSPRADYGDMLPGPYEDVSDGGTRGNDDNDSGSGGHGPGVPYNHTVEVLAAAGFDTTAVEHAAAVEGGDKMEAEFDVATFHHAPYSWRAAWRGHRVVLDNPVNHFTIQEPIGGCREGYGGSRTSANARARQCKVATNAGFFNTHTHACLGNLVVEGKAVQMPMIQNVNFGITTDGRYVVGYLNETMAASYEWHTLVAGVVWLVRDGQSFVRVSEAAENMATQESGGGFVGLHAARIALGHDANGSLVIVHVETEPGIDLYDFADLLVDMGVVNAINLDGGGSVSLYQTDTLRNYVTDACTPGSDDKCERHVTSITCVHDAPVPTPSPPPRPPPPSPLDPKRDAVCALYNCAELPGPPVAPDGSSWSAAAVVGMVIAFSLLAAAVGAGAGWASARARSAPGASDERGDFGETPLLSVTRAGARYDVASSSSESLDLLADVGPRSTSSRSASGMAAVPPLHAPPSPVGSLSTAAAAAN
ncbi:N-acetylglucosamine-1-phosphodiester alpha-N-acetylglucosaminidase [Thecamonas trahens ATCC 50062]|uniref:N-acetylglucosamine-1-phosphodiester alpha-N-acetylglucosaminidase n=1 Tax=Thecamonas trahens ATCC 50062 TaxID=461836 RepID=A0A0L0DJV9_THETB|nr:N-acetylglucosamine-1-phosphodiester alpha-N-acetylglucosaminidase [Thecamonas trahens ATCC 50062]KNC52567.1 N-acetylglucosamine-1-phosphodiester alpha-N-acetylglucosaminidase [Thecamonas trahens ATCC 50062]|eukprot:XP_013755357.1 N-acetylglucosamine-1-phosphodiester alpha-N-acetylglucosaminidase [Thecamonas trahens ATCC 50062]